MLRWRFKKYKFSDNGSNCSFSSTLYLPIKRTKEEIQKSLNFVMDLLVVKGSKDKDGSFFWKNELIDNWIDFLDKVENSNNGYI